MQGFQDRLDEHREISSSELTGMPHSPSPGNPTARVAAQLLEVSARYREIMGYLAEDCEKELRFKEFMDSNIDELPREYQKILELRYKAGHQWPFIALKMCYSVDRAKHIDYEAVEKLRQRIEVSTF
jgi:hypothetical protein